MEYVPERWEVEVDMIQVDHDTREMLKELDMANLQNIMTSWLPRGGGRRR